MEASAINPEGIVGDPVKIIYPAVLSTVSSGFSSILASEKIVSPADAL